MADAMLQLVRTARLTVKQVRAEADRLGLGVDCSVGTGRGGASRLWIETRDGSKTLSPTLHGPREAALWLHGYQTRTGG